MTEKNLINYILVKQFIAIPKKKANEFLALADSVGI